MLCGGSCNFFWDVVGDEGAKVVGIVGKAKLLLKLLAYLLTRHLVHYLINNGAAHGRKRRHFHVALKVPNKGAPISIQFFLKLLAQGLIMIHKRIHMFVVFPVKIMAAYNPAHF